MKKLLLIFLFPIILQAQLLTLFSGSTEITYADTARSFNYYVDNTGTGDTLSTIAEVNALSLQGLDTVFFKRGCEWREQLTVPSSGVEGYPIVFTSYGSGDKPVIDGTDLITNWDVASSQVVWDAASATGDATSADYENTTIENRRVILNSSDISASGVKIRARIDASGSALTYVDGLGIGLRSGTTEQYNGTATRLTFNGNNSDSIEAGGYKYTDWVSFDLIADSSYLFHIFQTDAHDQLGLRWDGSNDSYYSTTETDYTLTESYSGSPSNIITAPTSLEVNGTLWASYLPTISVRIVLFNDTVGTQVASLSDVDADKEWFYQNDSLYIYSNGDPSVYYSSIEASRRQYGVYASSKQYITLDGIKTQYQGISGFLFTGAVSGYATVKNCYAYYSRGHGFYMSNGNSDNTFQDSKAEYTGSGFYSGIDCNNNTFIRDTSNHNIYYDGSIGAYNDGHGFGIEENNGALIEYCYAEDNRDNYTVDQNSQGYSVTIRYNKSFNSKSGRYGFNISRLGSGGDSYVYYNLSVNDGTGDGSAFWNEGTNGGNLYVYNNTFYCDSDITGTTIRIYDTGNNVTFKNNIIEYDRTSAGYYAFRPTALGTLDSDYNLYYAPNLTNMFREGANSYADLSTWVAGVNLDSNSVEADPLFTTTGSDFTLQAGSDAINNGADVGLTQDILGNPIVGNPDIGAYEKQ